jgi:hypothetical protein
LTDAGMAVDNRGTTGARENFFATLTCFEGSAGPVDRKKLRTVCHDLVRYSGR